MGYEPDSSLASCNLNQQKSWHIWDIMEYQPFIVDKQASWPTIHSHDIFMAYEIHRENFMW